MVERVIGRKGINKFFDLKLDFVSKEGRYRESKLSHMDANEKNLILAGVKKAILEGHKIEIVKTLKANGENCQVSWVPQAHAWIVASKNVAILVRDMADLDLYPVEEKLRYSFVTMMAECWLDIVSKLKHKELQNLKNDMAGRTWVGEYIGNERC